MKKRQRLARMLLLLAMTGVSLNSAQAASSTSDDRAQFYLGAGAGVTRLSSEFANDRRFLITDTPPSGSVFAGVDVSSHMSIEATATAADSAAVGQDQRIIGDLAYRDYGVSALAWLYRGKAGDSSSDRASRRGLSAFARLGAGYKDPDSALAPREARRRHLIAGIGAEYGWTNDVGARAEVVWLGRDARQLQVSLLKRFDLGMSEFGNSDHNRTGATPEQIWENRFYLNFPTIYFPDNDQRSPLSRRDQRRLDQLASQLLKAPGLQIEVRGHSDHQDSLRDALMLSRRRAITVSRYLQSRGIRGNRLHIRAYGDSDPLASPDGQPAPARNRRVDFAIFSPRTRQLAAGARKNPSP